MANNVRLVRAEFETAVKYLTKVGFVNSFPITFEYSKEEYIVVQVGFKIIEPTEYVVEMVQGMPTVVFTTDLPVGVYVTLRSRSDSTGVPHTYHYRGNAKGQSEFNQKTMDENFEYLDRIVEEVNDSAALTMDSLTGFEDSFDNVLDRTDAIERIANAANAKSESAIATANRADIKADGAVAAATQALDISKAADSKSDTAIKESGEAKATSGDALRIANEAKVQAGEADANSQAALAKATEAKEVSEGAVTTAGEAKEIADGIDGKAQQALDSSAQAVQEAQGATQTANAAKVTAEGIEAKADSAIVIAGEADVKAQEALDKATEGGMSESELISKSVGTDKWMREGAYGIGTLDNRYGYQTGSLDKYLYMQSGIVNGLGGGDFNAYYPFLLARRYTSNITAIGANTTTINFATYSANSRQWTQGFTHTNLNARADKNNVLHSGTGTPINTLNVSDMADTVVDSDDVTVTSGAVYRALDNKRDLDDNVFDGHVSIKSDGTVRGRMSYDGDGLQFEQVPEDGTAQTFTFPRYGEGGEILTDGKGKWTMPEKGGELLTKEGLGFISTTTLGIRAGYDIDNTEAIRSADALCASLGKALKFEAGVYAIIGSIDKKADWFADSRPTLAPFPQKNDDKKFLAPSKKDGLRGTSIILKDGSYSTVTNPHRSDEFASVSYGIKTESGGVTKRFDNIAIILDMDCFDSTGSLTSPETDNRANVDVGYLIDNSSAGLHYNLGVFGHFNKAGICIQNKGIPDDPDYNRFIGGSSMGYYGLAIVSSDGDHKSIGLSGSEFISFQLFGNDHISRKPNPLKPWQSNGYGHLLKIDGYTSATGYRINGHNFIGGSWRTYSNRPIMLDNASHVNVQSVNLELSQISNQPDTLNTKFKGTSNTFDVKFDNCRNFDYTLLTGDFEEVTGVSVNIAAGNIEYRGSGQKFIGVQATGVAVPRLNFTDKLGMVSGTSSIEGDSSGLTYRVKGTPVLTLGTSLNPANDSFDLGSSRAFRDLRIQNQPTVTSDERVKFGIEDIDEKYIRVMSRLKFKQFKLKAGTSGRTHFGIIAQEWIAACEDEGVDPKESGVLVGNETEGYAIRYAELQILHNAYVLWRLDNMEV